jgi:hypothetical protein
VRRKKSNLLESFPECTNIKKRIRENRQKENGPRIAAATDRQK